MTEVTDVVSPCEGLDPIENFDPNLKASSEGLSLTIEAALPDMSPVGFDDRGCEEALGMTIISETLSDGVDSEKREADFPVFLLDESVTDGVPEKRVVDGEEPQDSAVGFDVFPSPCFPTAMRCSDSYVAGVGASECQETLSPMVFIPLCSRSQRPPVLVCAEEKGTGMVGGDVEQPASVAIGVGGDGNGLKVEGGVGGDAMELPTKTICFILPTEPVCPILPCVHSLLASAVETNADGYVREEVQVSSTATGALRPQPTDGLWQPPSSPVEPVSEGVEKDKRIHGGAFVAQEVHGDLACGMPRSRRSSGQSSPSITPPRVRRVSVSPRPPASRRLTTEWGFKPCFRCAPPFPRVARARRQLRQSPSPDLAVFSSSEEEDLTEATVNSSEEEGGQHPHSREPDLSPIQEIDDSLAMSLSSPLTGEALLWPLTKDAGGSVATLEPIQCPVSVSSSPDSLLADEFDGSGLGSSSNGMLMAFYGHDGDAKSIPAMAGGAVGSVSLVENPFCLGDGDDTGAYGVDDSVAMDMNLVSAEVHPQRSTVPEVLSLSMADVQPVQASSVTVDLGKGKMEVGGVLLMPLADGSRLGMMKVDDSVDLGSAVCGNSQHFSATVCSLSPFCAPDVRQQLCDGCADFGSLEGGGHAEGGMVSEEARAPPVVREAMRPQPTDGLRQSPLPPVLPVSGADGGLGKAVPRSFATIVNPDRRADVELAFDPPLDGGNVVVMEDSDGQEDD
ncbi:hypothetical protein Dimus_029187 [Dionaea muscipula]